MGSAEDSIYAIMVLIDELKHDDVQLRLNSVRRLSTIAVALGPERTRNELVPYLTDSTDDDDEVLVALAEELGGFAQYVGGPEHVFVLLQPLEAVCSAEETVVREKATASLCKIVAQMPPEHVMEHFVSMLKRLATSEWFSCRISACSLFTGVYTRVPSSTRTELRGHFNMLCRDEAPMVRRAAASNLAKFAPVVEKDFIRGEVIPMFVSLAQDEQDSVRLLSVENCVSLARLLSPEDSATFVLPSVRASVQDKSWRVRYMVAEQLQALCEAMGPQITQAELVPAFVALLKDTEPEVRTAGASRVAAVGGLLPADLLVKAVLPCVRELVNDPSQHVRSALAGVVMNVAPVLGRAATIDYLLPLLLQLLKDEDSEVRLNIITNLQAISKVIGIEMLAQSLLPAVMDLASDKQWRVRLAVIEHIPQLAVQLGRDLFDTKLSALCFQWMCDTVYSVRDAATQNLRKLSEAFGVPWFVEKMLPRVTQLQQHPNYLHRITTLFSVSAVAAICTPDIVSAKLLPVVLRMATDSVPNIRFNVAKCLQGLMSRVDAQSVQQQIKPCLQSLSSDPDRDVKFFAQRALGQC